jgi:hypothetical protein
MKMNIKKAFIFSREDELESRWWHRLIKVLIYGSTILILVFSISTFFDNIDSWNNPDPKYIYSFEPGYEEAFGFSKPCTFLPENSEEHISIKCGYIDESVSKNPVHFLPDFLDKYSKSISYREEFLTETKPDCSKSKDIFCKYRYLSVNYNLLNEKILEGKFVSIEAKSVFVLSILLINIFLMIFIPLAWFLVLKFVAYGAFVYIVLGKKKGHNVRAGISTEN